MFIKLFLILRKGCLVPKQEMGVCSSLSRKEAFSGFKGHETNIDNVA